MAGISKVKVKRANGKVVYKYRITYRDIYMASNILRHAMTQRHWRLKTYINMKRLILNH